MNEYELNIDILQSCLRTMQELYAAGLATEQDVEDVLNNLKEYKEEYVTSNEIRKLATQSVSFYQETH